VTQAACSVGITDGRGIYEAHRSDGLRWQIYIPSFMNTGSSVVWFNFFLIRIVGGRVQTGSTPHVGH
jgi:hypothetical protein